MSCGLEDDEAAALAAEARECAERAGTGRSASCSGTAGIRCPDSFSYEERSRVKGCQQCMKCKARPAQARCSLARSLCDTYLYACCFTAV